MKINKVLQEAIDTNINSELTLSKKENRVCVPVFYSEDSNGNFNFDIESMKDEFDRFISALEDYNENSDFDWDNVE